MRTLILSMMLLVASTTIGAELSETIDRTFDVKPGATVTLTNVNGGITVTAWDQPRVRVIARKEVEADSGEIKNVLRELRVDMQPRNGGLVITTHQPRRNDGVGGLFDWLFGDQIQSRVRYELTVPRNMNLDVSNTNGGIRLTGIAGDHDLETTNGRMELARCSGSLDASTTNGSINAELVGVTRNQPLTLETTNGRIAVTVPADMAVDVDASTTNGAITSELPVSTTRISKNSLRGSINGGGTPLRVRTTNGGIEIRASGKS